MKRQQKWTLFSIGFIIANAQSATDGVRAIAVYRLYTFLEVPRPRASSGDRQTAVRLGQAELFYSTANYRYVAVSLETHTGVGARDLCVRHFVDVVPLHVYRPPSVPGDPFEVVFVCHRFRRYERHPARGACTSVVRHTSVACAFRRRRRRRGSSGEFTSEQLDFPGTGWRQSGLDPSAYRRRSGPGDG